MKKCKLCVIYTEKEKITPQKIYIKIPYKKFLLLLSLYTLNVIFFPQKQINDLKI